MKNISYKRLSLTFLMTILMTLVPACFEALQLFDKERAELMLGFPIEFYMIKHVADGKFAVHFNITGFAANIVVIYIAITLIAMILKKLRNEYK